MLLSTTPTMNPCLHVYSWHELSWDVWTSVLGRGVFAPRLPASSTLLTSEALYLRLGMGGGGGGALPVAAWSQWVKGRLPNCLPWPGVLLSDEPSGGALSREYSRTRV